MDYSEFLDYCKNNHMQEVNDFLKNFSKVLGSGLSAACNNGNSAIVSRLVEVPGLDINYQDEKYGDTAAHRASMNGHTECVRILAETGRVDWNKRDKCGYTPLYCALEYGRSDIVDIIVQQPNIDYNVKTDPGARAGHQLPE